MSYWGREVVPTERVLKEVAEKKLSEITQERDLLREEAAKFKEQSAKQLAGLQQEISALKAVAPDQIRKHVKALISLWSQPAAVPPRGNFIDDPVWGQLYLEEELCSLVAHPLLQRLNHIKQLAFAYLVFPSATHSRLSHCLGACKLAQLALESIFDKDLLYSDGRAERISLTPWERRRLVLKAKAAAMLHDVGHGPFGHALDRFVGNFDPRNTIKHPDKKYSRDYIERFLADRLPDGTDAANQVAILGEKQHRVALKGWDCLVADIVDSSLDIDRMDYLTRDAHMTGLSVGKAQPQALIEKMRPYQDGEQIVLSYDHSCLPDLAPFLYTREMMFLNCYDHPRKAAAERVFTRLVEALIDSHNISVGEIMMLADEQIVAVLALALAGSESNNNLLAVLLQNQEYELVLDEDARRVQSWSQSRAECLGKQTYVDMPKLWERTIADESGLGTESSWRVLVVVPAEEVSVPVELGTRILFKTATGYTTKKLSQVVPRLQVPLAKLIEARDRIRVFVDARLEEPLRSGIGDVAKRVLGVSDA